MGYSASDNQTVLSTQEGAFGLSANDDFLAAPDLFSKLDKQSSQTSNNMDMAKLENLFSRIIDRPIILNTDMKIDGKSFATTIGREYSNEFFTQAGTNTRQI